MSDKPKLTRGQNLMLQAVLPILLIGIILPIGLVVLLLWIDGSELSEAVDRGELFLAGGNAAFTGCLILLAARPDKAVGASISSMVVVIMVVLPCYVAWAHISTASARHAEYATSSALEGGVVAAAVGILLAAVLVLVAFFSRPNGSSPASDRLT
ncbi:MAG: hypothetical protein JJE35_09690 [Thermoleophilia bacterium]|nr:hypothetical protein [Thermoleophilia bacterium]